MIEPGPLTVQLELSEAGAPRLHPKTPAVLDSILRVRLYEGKPMNDFDIFLELPITAQAAAVCFVVCATCLFVMLLLAPRRDCFFFRWRPETRFLALLASPTLLILWPIVLYAWFLKSRGIEPGDLDFDDD